MLSTVADTLYSKLFYPRDLFTRIQPISLTIFPCNKENFLYKGTELVNTIKNLQVLQVLVKKNPSRSKKIQFLVSFSVKTRLYTTCVVTNRPTQKSLIMAKYLVYIPHTSLAARVLVNVVTKRKNYYSVVRCSQSIY
jgi:hypothetical protein